MVEVRGMAQGPEVTPTGEQPQTEVTVTTPQRGGATFLWGFVLGLIIGGAAMTAVLVRQWYMPLQSIREENASLQDQLARLQENVTKANEIRRKAEAAAEQLATAFRQLQDALSKLGIQLPEASEAQKPPQPEKGKQPTEQPQQPPTPQQ